MDVALTTNMIEAIENVEKTNSNLESELFAAEDARALMDLYVRAQRLISFGIAALSRKVHDPQEVARVTGTSVGRAKDTVRTGEALKASEDLSLALQQGDVSLEQAAEIASAVESAPRATRDLLQVAREESFHVLREKARKARLEAEQHRGLKRRAEGRRADLWTIGRREQDIRGNAGSERAPAARGGRRG